MQWRRRTAWERKDWISLGVLAGSILLGGFLISSDALRVGIRQGILFLLVFVFVGAAVVPLVRHAPLPVLHFAQPVTFILGGVAVAVVNEPPARYIALAAAVLGVVQLVLHIRRYRTLTHGQHEAPTEDNRPHLGKETSPRPGD